MLSFNVREEREGRDETGRIARERIERTFTTAQGGKRFID